MQQVRRLFHRHESKERADRRQAGVTASHAVVALVFNVRQEVADESDINLLERQLGWRFAGLFARELEEEPERVAIGSNRVRTRRQLGAKPIREELLDKSREGCCSSWLHLLNTLGSQCKQFGNGLDVPVSVCGIGVSQIRRELDHLPCRFLAVAIPVQQGSNCEGMT